MVFFKKLSPSTRFVIAETGRVCACIAGIIIVESLIMKGLSKLTGGGGQ